MADKEAEKTEDKKPDEAAVEGEGDAPKRRLPGKKLVLFIGAPLLLIILGVVGAYIAGVFDAPPPAEGEEGYVESGEDGEPIDPNAAPVYYNVPDMVVNLQAERSRAVYLKISMSLELVREIDIPAVERVLPRVLDNFQVYLRELRVDELRGSAGMYRLREELLMRVNQAVAPVKVKDVLFREMLVQ